MPADELYSQIRQLLQPYSDSLELMLISGNAGLIAVQKDGEVTGEVYEFPATVGLLILFGELENPAITHGITII